MIAKDGYKKIDKKHRIDFWIGIGIGTWSTAILMTMAGYLAADYLNKDMLIGLAIVNPVYFFCMMIGAMKNFSISVEVVTGTTQGPFIYLVSTEWALLFAVLNGIPDVGGVWTNVGLTYTYTVSPIAPCATPATATIIVTEQLQADAGIDGSLIVCAGTLPTDAELFAALTGTPDLGGVRSEERRVGKECRSRW
mgnify:CR=1 FL=1